MTIEKSRGKVCIRCGVKLESDWGFPTYCMDCLRRSNEAKRLKTKSSRSHLFDRGVQKDRSVEREDNEINSHEKGTPD